MTHGAAVPSRARSTVRPPSQRSFLHPGRKSPPGNGHSGNSGILAMEMWIEAGKPSDLAEETCFLKLEDRYFRNSRKRRLRIAG